MAGGGGRDVPGGVRTHVVGSQAPGDSEGTGVQTPTRGQVRLDPAWQRRVDDGLKLQDAGKGYWKVSMPGHPIADANGRVRLHRAVLFEAVEGAAQACHWCGHEGLYWHANVEDRNHGLTADHVNSDKADNRVKNLVPAHKWCNENRHVIEELKIPWAWIASIAPAERRPLYNPGRKCPTAAAYEYQRAARDQKPIVAPKLAGSRARTPWDAQLGPVPAALLDRYPQLHRLGKS